MSLIPPTNNPTIIIDDFINYATAHLSTISGVTPEVDTTPIEMTDAQLVVAENASLEGATINESTAIAFESNVVSEPSPQALELSEQRLIQDANNEPTPSELQADELPKDDIQPVPNYKSKLKVPDALVLAMRKYGVGRTPLERAHFLAQTNHESGNFIYKEEIASGKAYEGRKDLGNTQAGDGVRYKGRGYIQLTGRANYNKYGPIAGADFVGHPTAVATKYYAETACLFWKSNRLGAKCVDSSTTTIKVVTKRINGGYNGLDDRIKKFTLYWTDLQKDNTLWA